MTCSYPIGIPVILFIALYRIRNRRYQIEVQIAYGILYEGFSKELWWFELFDMGEKLFLTSLLGFIDASFQCQSGMLVVGVYLIVSLLCSPYVRQIDDRLAGFAQSYLLLILLIGLVLQQNLFVPGSFEDIAASVIMLVVVAALAVLIIVHLIIFVRKFIRNRQRASALKDAQTADSMVFNPLAGNGNAGTGTGAPNTPRRTAPDTDGSSDSGAATTGTGTGTGSGTGGRAMTKRESSSSPDGLDLTQLSTEDRALAEMLAPSPTDAVSPKAAAPHRVSSDQSGASASGNRVFSFPPLPPVPASPTAVAAGSGSGSVVTPRDSSTAIEMGALTSALPVASDDAPPPLPEGGAEGDGDAEIAPPPPAPDS